MTLLVRTPTSKSMTQRALVLAALAQGPSELHDPLDCDDSRHLRSMLEAFGTTFVEGEAGRRLWVHPAASLRIAPARALHCGNAGTAIRFGAALALLTDGPFVLDGDAHMQRRPIGPLTECLRTMGIRVEHLGHPGCPPMRLERLLPAPSVASLDGSLSSQFASALLLVAPLLPNGLQLELTGRIVSRPYLDMTIDMLRAGGVDVTWQSERELRVLPGRPRGRITIIESDWSAAAFILAAGRITGTELVPMGLLEPGASRQGDAAVVRWLAELDGAATNEVDLTDCPDLIAPLAAVALFARRPTRLRGAAHTRWKECDRVAVLASEFRKLGADVIEQDDGLTVNPMPSAVIERTCEPAAERVLLDPHEDHRMAMAFGIASLRMPSIHIKNKGCVSKSFPEFWDVLEDIRAYAATR